MLNDGMKLPLRERNIQVITEDTRPSRKRAGGQQNGTKPLRMNVTTEAGVLVTGNPRLKDKARLLDLANANPCVSTNLANAPRQVEKDVSPPQSNGRKTSIGARSPLPTPSFLL